MANRRILIVNYVYPRLLKSISVEGRSETTGYAAFSEKLNSLDFGIDYATADALQARDWDPSVLVANSVIGWSVWLSEQRDLGFWRTLIPQTVLQVHKIFGRGSLDQRVWGLFVALAAEVLRSDVVYFGHPSILSARHARSLKNKGVVLVLNHSASVPSDRVLRHLDGFVSCVRWLTDFALSRGVKALHLRLGFKDDGVTREIRSPEMRTRDIEVSFVGTVSADQHANTVPLLEAIAHQVDGLRIYAPPTKLVTENEILGPLYFGEAWGKEMYKVLERSKVTVNRHGVSPGGEAANMRLYEATGAGAALVTDRRKFIEEIFDSGIEVLLYDSPTDAAEKVQLLLDSDPFRRELALAGQQRTLTSHTIEQRAHYLDRYLRDLLGGPVVS